MLNLQIDSAVLDHVIDRAIDAAVRRLERERPGGPEQLLLDKHQAAAALGLSVSSLDRLTHPRGDLRAVRLAGRTLYSQDELRRWIAARTAGGEGGPQP